MIMAKILLKKQIMAIWIMANFWKNSKLWQYALSQTFLKSQYYDNMQSKHSEMSKYFVFHTF